MTMDSSRGAGAQQGLKAWGGHSWIRNSLWLVTEGSGARPTRGGWAGWGFCSRPGKDPGGEGGKLGCGGKGRERMGDIYGDR